MRYVSTRSEQPPVGFRHVLLAGLAPDGGLYMPEHWPQISASEFAALAGRSYADVAFRVMAPFIGDEIAEGPLRRMIAECVAAFETALVAPLVQYGPADWLLELFHGPTLAFKDVALQLLGRLFSHVLGESGERRTIVVATSGDTGSAAIEAIKGRSGLRIVVLHPDGLISEVQRRQMTCVVDANVHNIAVAGTFDDCQRLVKELFADRAFSMEVGLSAVNSINWARIIAQAVYYVTSGLALGTLNRPVSFVVPTGNFGDIFAGYVAARLGLPIHRLIVASNVNDILVRTLDSSAYETRGVTPTTSPSMDIEVSSNFERLLFEALGRDAVRCAGLYASLRQSGRFEVPVDALAGIKALFAAERADEAEVSEALKTTYETAARLIDPHTGVGVVAGRKARAANLIETGEVAVVLATAHPAKFADTVARATGVRPALPGRLAGLMSKGERYQRMPADLAALKAFVRALPW